ncbi:MAG: YdcF family protein [Bradyrhizobium sp.]
MANIVPHQELARPVDKRESRLPSAAEIAEINRRHLVDTPLQPADLLFVFGSRKDAARRVDEACRLWREGFFRWAIVSGGMTPGSHLSECAIIKAEMVARGIPADFILEEHRAMNTGENVIFSLPVIDAALGLKNIRSVICLGSSWTARRYPMTLHRHWPEVTKMLVTVDSFATPRALWHTDPEFSRRMLREWDKIEPYKARGFIAEWPE